MPLLIFSQSQLFILYMSEKKLKIGFVYQAKNWYTERYLLYIKNCDWSFNDSDMFVRNVRKTPNDFSMDSDDL